VRARDLLGPGSNLSRLLPGYEDRPAQLEMAEAVERALQSERALLVEAGTGTGKTLAYLVPALLSGKRVVVSTATRALQEQIFVKDLPLVRELLGQAGLTFRATLMKGLSNYLCKRRFHEAAARGVDERVLARIEAWAAETETGDRAELVDLPEDNETWRLVQSSTETRIGAQCKYYDECFVTRMRKDAEDADLVIVNHHLFFADLALRSSRGNDMAGAIPAYDAVIFDEAHAVEDVATDFFGFRVSSARIEHMIRDAERSLSAAGLLDVLGKGEARPLCELVLEASENLFASFGPGTIRGAETKRILAPKDVTKEVRRAWSKLDATLHALSAYCEDKAKRDEGVMLVARRAKDLRSDLNAILGVGDHEDTVELDEPPILDRVVWIDERERSTSLGASPIDMGPRLREALFDRVPSVICTSATLTTTVAGAPSFHFAKARLGVPPTADELVVPSPFDFENRAAFYVARDLPEPNAPAYEDAAVERILELVEITRGGAFVLCTSNRAMRTFHRRLKGRLRHPLMVQGEAPKHLLLSRFRAEGDAVLVATMSFWEGVDVPGRALRLVILDKVPFAVPTDPIFAARSARIDREGGNSFTQYAVPSAAITLKQGFGRLIRTQTDAGIVALLDRRMVTKGYGKTLASSLPPARRLDTLDELKTFWDAVGASC
jgi:ATP-dependent DNA helicase DinG